MSDTKFTPEQVEKAKQDLSVDMSRFYKSVASEGMYDALVYVATSGKFQCFDDLSWDIVNAAIARAEGR